MLTTFELINTDIDINRKRITKYRTNLNVTLLDEFPIAKIEKIINNELSEILHNGKRQNNPKDVDISHFRVVTDMKTHELLIIIYDFIKNIPTYFEIEIDFD